MTTENTRRIEVTVGPDAGQTFDASHSDADQAISEGWAREHRGMQISTPPARSAEDQQKVIDLAKAGVERLRAAKPEQQVHQENTQRGGTTQTRDMSSGGAGRYPTKGK